MVTPEIKQIPQKIVVGIHTEMSVVQDLTGKLWGELMPKYQAINYKVGQEKISMQLYPEKYFEAFNPHATFTKWASVEVNDMGNQPEGISSYTIPEGLYAVFQYKGSSADKRIFQYIFSEWLPNSEYLLDARPHFEVLGAKYKNNDPQSEEDIYIPIRKK